MYFDELDEFLDNIRTLKIARSEEKRQVVEEDIIDEMLDLYLLGFYEGAKDAGEELGVNVDPSVEEAQEVINRPIAGKTFRERVRDYVSGNMGDTTGTPEEAIARVAETDAVRIYNESKLNTAKRHGATAKTWNTMEDNRVRDSHYPLDKVTVPIDAYFYTYDGDKATAPSQFTLPQNNVNCRCWLTFSK